MTLALDEFLRRFLLHVLPKGFVRIRHFGFLAHRRRATALPLCFQLLGSAPEPQAQQEVSSASPRDLWFCPQCGGPMVTLEGLQLPRSSFVLHLWRSRYPHETTIDITKSLRVSARTLFRAWSSTILVFPASLAFVPQ